MRKLMAMGYCKYYGFLVSYPRQNPVVSDSVLPSFSSPERATDAFGIFQRKDIAS